jgi:para-nitrobenzyl esterase
MKNRLRIAFSILVFSISAHAQFDCLNGRFSFEVFNNILLTSDITYGSAINVGGQTQSLELDIYQPDGDTASIRPLLIMAHGGSFIGGNKTGADVVPICQKFAKLGYVVASIEYRLGFGGILPNEETATNAVYRATGDMRAAVRFFRSTVENGNPYKIHPDYIFAGGVSAGAFMALHLAYLDDVSEIPSTVDTTVLGGIEGNSGNPGNSSEVRAIVNLCGAIGDTSWINAGDVPCLSMHGTNDGTVPYGSDVITVLFIPLMEVDGSASVANQLDNLGIENTFVSWQNADHVPFVSSLAYQDSVFQFMVPFLRDQINCDETQPNDIAVIDDETQWFPNPATNFIRFNSPNGVDFVEICDLTGKVFLSETRNNEISGMLSLDHLPRGIYNLAFTENGKQKRVLIAVAP